MNTFELRRFPLVNIKYAKVMRFSAHIRARGVVAFIGIRKLKIHSIIPARVNLSGK